MLMEKLFVIKKYVMAKSAHDAIKKDKKTQVDDVWVHEDWHKMDVEKKFEKKDKLGFTK